jgi:hypothetical protein
MPRSNDTLPKDIPASPFANDETAERIIVLKLSFFYDTIFVIVSVHHLRQLFARGLPCLWAEWGPDATRWLHGIGDYGSHSSVSGSRFCTQTYMEIPTDHSYNYTGEPSPSSDRDRKTIMVFDFNPRPIYKCISGEYEDTSKVPDSMIGKPITNQWTMHSTTVEQPVISRLPFTLYASKYHVDYSEVMISPGHLLGRDGNVSCVDHP